MKTARCRRDLGLHIGDLVGHQLHILAGLVGEGDPGMGPEWHGPEAVQGVGGIHDHWQRVHLGKFSVAHRKEIRHRCLHRG